MTPSARIQGWQSPLALSPAAVSPTQEMHSARLATKDSRASFLSWPRIRQLGCSIADQGFSVGGMFLANIALARTQTKAEYGVFALTYSVFTFLAGLHNAVVLEAYTVYGSGRYHKNFRAYARLLWASNAWLCLALSAMVALSWAACSWVAPRFASRTLLGLALASGLFLTASFVRRTFYMMRWPELAARFSTAFFLADAALLWFFTRAGKLDGFWAFTTAAFSWTLAALFVTRELPGKAAPTNFLRLEPGYWAEHWKYSRWVLVTALVFQFLTQGYYWLAAGILSVKEAGELRALSNLVMPLDQLFTAVTFLILPALSLRFASERLAGLFPLWKSYSLGWLSVTGLFAAAMLLLGRPAMHLLYAGRFDDVAPLLAALGFLPLIMGAGNTINAALKAMEKPQAVFYAYLFSGAATFLIGWPLILRFGVRGAVSGMLCSAAVYTATLAACFISHVRAEGRVHIPAFPAPSQSSAKAKGL